MALRIEYKRTEWSLELDFALRDIDINMETKNGWCHLRKNIEVETSLGKDEFSLEHV